ncbi:helix-turn-helix domain-containing protein [Spirosoma pollinicola]|uniref:AraC family transcriptional regulator n=1 Tax=Spirosoma pollinicola TaxID=2057025 RepID=A0A2K8YXX4_9BACT|nr:helix-turn-helix domain-containing protein [Spirosoma pollinicola]AUD02475.1 AraC family transcriptional regulator [Spirosoma pollinicola]
MAPDESFPAISPEMARERFLVKNESWPERFKDNFNQFIVAPLEYSGPVIKLPLPPSRTGNHVLILVTAGQVELTVGHLAYTLSAQKLVIVPALQIFTLNTIREDATGFLCFFSPTLLLNAGQGADFDFLKLTGNPLVSLSVQQTAFINTLFDRLTIEYTENGSIKTDLIRPYLLALLAEINRAYVGTMEAKTDAGDRLVQGFMDLLTTQVRVNRSVSQYAEQLNVSPNHLNKVIKGRTGKSPSVWIDERVVLEAKVLLFQSGMSIAQIANQMGFDDQSGFGKLFRKYAKMSPGDFRVRTTTSKMIDFDQS